MNNRIFLIFLLVTPLIVIIGSTLAFTLGYSPENTKNNGTFFDKNISFTVQNQTAFITKKKKETQNKIKKENKDQNSKKIPLKTQFLIKKSF